MEERFFCDARWTRHEDRLLVRRLPPQLSADDRADLLKHFGATEVLMSLGNKQLRDDAALALFPSASSASLALRRLHQLVVLDSFLVVEFARKSQDKFFDSRPERYEIVRKRLDPSRSQECRTTSSPSSTTAAAAASTTTTTSTQTEAEDETSASFPPSSLDIVARISNALLNAAPFYRRVLLLMRALDLPAPFGRHPNIDAPIFRPPASIMTPWMSKAASFSSRPASRWKETPKGPVLNGGAATPSKNRAEREGDGNNSESESEMESEGEKEETLIPPHKLTTPRPKTPPRPPIDSRFLRRLIEDRKRKRLEDPVDDPLRGRTDESLSRKVFDARPPPGAKKIRILAPTSLEREPATMASTSGLSEKFVEADVDRASETVATIEGFSVEQVNEFHEEPAAKPAAELAALTMKKPSSGPFGTLAAKPASDRVVPQPQSKTVSPEHLSSNSASVAPTKDSNDGVKTAEGDSLKSASSKAVSMENGSTKAVSEEAVGNEAASSSPAEYSAEKLELLSLKDIEKNRATEEEKSANPVFKNWEMGEPSSRLYIKNLAKQVTEEELKRVFLNFVDRTKDLEKFELRLMTHGRMKGQAFVTLPSVKAAKEALLTTNGFIWRSRPMVVCFARGAGVRKS